MTTERTTTKALGKPVTTRTETEDGVMVGANISIDLTTGDTAAELAGICEVFPTVVQLIEAYAVKAQRIIAENAISSRLEYAQNALWQAGEVVRYMDKGDARSAVRHAVWMMQCMWRLDVKGIEPTIVTGIKTTQGGRKGGQVSKDIRRGPGSKRARILVESNKYKGTEQAKVASIARKTGASARYVRIVLGNPEL